ncbi:glycosyltransferase [Halotia branconii]|uniref:Glycosyltransferase n=1 Tax=Halotia branconii CENA392 TaxID=1539056 RepID=A0AAJ6NP23_9CYAN|nr:glycosyltransferase [Halotia branconii]WGV24070.1 glycosyltransferase [Halotia branconii CENA392]
MEGDNLSVGIVVTNMNEDTGGIVPAIAGFANVLVKQEIHCHLFTLDDPELGSQVSIQDVKLHSFPTNFLGRRFGGFHPNAEKAIWQLASTELNLIHNYGMWMFPNIYARKSAVGNHIPLIISPEGMLEPWSLKNAFLKKKLAWLLYERQNLNSASLFHATSIAELKSIRSLGFTQPIAVIPHGVDLPDLKKLPSKEVLTEVYPELSDKKWLLFLSRLHPKKGLDNLLCVWHKLAFEFLDWHLIIAGPDLINYQSQLEPMIKDFGLEKRVTFTGMLSGEKKAAAFANADLFVLPTHSENFGNVVPESLAYGVPVITTQGTPWQDLSTYECGWWIENNQQALAKALNEGMQMSSQVLKAMGQKGRYLVEQKYSWEPVGRDMATVYRWLINGGEAPSCVQL